MPCVHHVPFFVHNDSDILQVVPDGRPPVGIQSGVRAWVYVDAAHLPPESGSHGRE